MSVRDQDKKSGCSSGLAAAGIAVGVGACVGAALYYFFNKRQEIPGSEGATTSGWHCEPIVPFSSHTDMYEESDSYITISEHSTTDTSINNYAESMETDTEVNNSMVNELEILELSSIEFISDNNDDNYNRFMSLSVSDYSASEESLETEDNLLSNEEDFNDFEENESLVISDPESSFIVEDDSALMSNEEECNVSEQYENIVISDSESSFIVENDSALMSSEEDSNISEQNEILVISDSESHFIVQDNNVLISNDEYFNVSEQNESLVNVDSDSVSTEQIYSVSSMSENGSVNNPFEIDSFERTVQYWENNGEYDSEYTEWDVIDSAENIPNYVHIVTSVRPVTVSQNEEHSNEPDICRDQAFRKRSWSLEECSICFDVMLRDHELMTLPCTHNFHTQCILPWLQEKQTCPNCRETA